LISFNLVRIGWGASMVIGRLMLSSDYDLGDEIMGSGRSRDETADKVSPPPPSLSPIPPELKVSISSLLPSCLLCTRPPGFLPNDLIAGRRPVIFVTLDSSYQMGRLVRPKSYSLPFTYQSGLVIIIVPFPIYSKDIFRSVSNLGCKTVAKHTC